MGAAVSGWITQTTSHIHGVSGILNNVFCAFKRAIKCSVELLPFFVF